MLSQLREDVYCNGTKVQDIAAAVVDTSTQALVVRGSDFPQSLLQSISNVYHSSTSTSLTRSVDFIPTSSTQSRWFSLFVCILWFPATAL